MKSLPDYPKNQDYEHEYDKIDKKQPLLLADQHDEGGSTSHMDQKLPLSSSSSSPPPPPPLPARTAAATAYPPPPPPPPPFEPAFMMNDLPTPPPPPPPPVPDMLFPTKPARRRRGCLISLLSIISFFVLAAIFVFAIYGIPASHCCKCLKEYDQCDRGSSSATTHQACLDRFYTCTSDTNYIFFSCNDRLYQNRDNSCWIQYF